MFFVNVSTCSEENSDARGELAWHQIAVLKRLSDRQRKIRFAILTLVKTKGVALDVGRWCRGQAKVQGVKMRECRLPSATNRVMTLVSNDNIEVSAGKFALTAEHGLQQTNGDLLLLAHHPRLKPITSMLVENVLQCLKCLCRQLLTIH